ncbi:MAG: cupin domain-containing protein [Erysipelotrichaceae bacterium]|nr:cupin domain-containing protein [Erysipelotrichaceae bacterium]
MEEEIRKVSPFETGGVNPVIQYCSGRSWLASLTGPDAQVDIANVTFEPGCRNNWHVHHGCQQILVCVGGEGWYQEWGKEAVKMVPGTVIEIPLDVKHWHGAAKDSWFEHLSIMSRTVSGSHEWLEPVDDETYNSL